MAAVTEAIGSIFTAPPNTLLLHACNARGSWGAGVALAFKQHYPSAYNIYHAHCTSPPAGTTLPAHQRSLPGTCLLIPPSEDGAEGEERHWIGCLFTSEGYGRSKAGAGVILENTKTAVEDLRRQVEELRGKGEDIGGVWAVRINSGKFGVRWEETREVLEAGGVDMRVVRPEDEDEGGGTSGEKGRGSRMQKRTSDGASDGGGKRARGAAGGAVTKRGQRGALDGWLK